MSSLNKLAKVSSINWLYADSLAFYKDYSMIISSWYLLGVKFTESTLTSSGKLNVLDNIVGLLTKGYLEIQKSLLK